MKRSFFTLPILLKIGLISLALGTILPKAIAQITLPQVEAFTVRIDRPSKPGIAAAGGSGVLVKQMGNEYSVLTNCHVIKGIPGTYTLWINGNDRYPVSITEPNRFCHSRVDLAVLTFTSTQRYSIASLRPERDLKVLVTEATSITAAGFPNPYDGSGTRSGLLFNPIGGALVQIQNDVANGYELVHNIPTLDGMSGGPIFDAQGKLIAINGQTLRSSAGRAETYYYAAIPIHYYTDWQGISTPVTPRQTPQTPTPRPPTPPPIPSITTPSTPRPTPSTPRPTPRTPTHLGLPVEPYSYTSARVSANGTVTTYNAQSPLGKYTETALRLPANAVSLDMVAIPGGTFTMGSPESEALRDSDESPQHRVTIPDFFMGRYEVTQAQWFAVMGSDYNANGWQERWRSLDSNFKGDNLPIVRVSWDDAQEFIQRLNRLTGKTYRLPTEAEWEYAARAGTTTPFSYGDNITPSVVNYDGNYPYGNAPKGEYRVVTIEVNSLYPNPWGLYHIHGNVWEWVQDQYHDSYANKPSTLVSDGSNPWITNTNALASNDLRVLRGGSWFNVAWSSRSANRYRGNRDLRYDFNGFRVVLVP